MTRRTLRRRVELRRLGTARASAVALASSLAVGSTADAITRDAEYLAAVERLHGGAIEHCDEAVAEGDFEAIFECGDELFEVTLNAVDGVGAHVGDGGRFSRVPRADRTGFAEWANHLPARATGPNAASCVACHQGAAIGGAGDGSGPAEVNVVRDPTASADPSRFIQRNTPHLFGPGALQRLAEEMTEELRARFEAGLADACAAGQRVEVALTAKGIDFGSIGVHCEQAPDLAGVEGVDSDLIVRPFQWKGVEPSLRSFSRGAEHNELGMQPVELTGDGVDGDGDGVVDEISIPDMTAMSVYLAAQPRPVTQLELMRLRMELARIGDRERIAALGLPDLTSDDVASVRRGEQLFDEVGCTDCHRPRLVLEDPVFSEPSTVAGYRDDPFPAGQPALTQVVSFDLTRDLPDNRYRVGRRRVDLGNFERTRDGGAVVRLYGDLKRHDLGSGLAENVDESGHGASVWMTKELWGVGSTAPYLHDGRASTIHEAILEHGGDAEASRSAYLALAESEAAHVLRFLDNLVLFFPEEEPAAPAEPRRRRR